MRAAAKSEESPEEKMFQGVIAPWCSLLYPAMALLFIGFCVMGTEERSYLGAALAQILLPGLIPPLIVIYACFQNSGYKMVRSVSLVVPCHQPSMVEKKKTQSYIKGMH